MRTKKLQCSILLSILAVTYPNGGCNLIGKGFGTRNRPELKVRANVILITISTIRADHVSCFGYQRDTTPNFDKFSKSNTLFLNAFATSSWAMPTHGSIFTSLFPSVHGATGINKRLTDKCDTLAEVLAANGYYCAGFCCNPRLSASSGFAQGFDIYDDYSVETIVNSLASGGNHRFDINKRRTNDLINDAAIRWLQNNIHKPFFMFVHYYDNHWDYLPPEPYDKLYDGDYQGAIDGTDVAREPLFSNPPGEDDVEHIIALYDGEVKQTDNDLGEMLSFLEKRGLMANSIVVVMGDHGEQFYEHGHTSHHGTYDELIHVPLAISVPTIEVKEHVIGSLVSQVDILPTILDFLQIPLPEDCQGESLKPLIEGNTEVAHEFVYAEYAGGAVHESHAVRSARYKYIEQEGEPFMYDLLNDPSEQQKIPATDFTEEARILQKAFYKLMEKTSR